MRVQQCCYFLQARSTDFDVEVTLRLRLRAQRVVPPLLRVAKSATTLRVFVVLTQTGQNSQIALRGR